MAGIILTAAGLGFLGLGAQPPLPEWGAMISTGRQYLLDQWWVPTIPGSRSWWFPWASISLGDGLRDVLDPRSGAANDRRPSPRLSVEVTCGSLFHAQGHGSRLCAASASTLGQERLGIVGESGSGKSQTGPGHPAPDWPQRYHHGRRLEFRGIDILNAERPRTAARDSRQPHLHDHAGPALLPESGDDRRRADRGGLSGPFIAGRREARPSGRWICWRRCVSASRRESFRALSRTRFPAAWASAS